VFVDGAKGRRNVCDKKFQRYAKDNRTAKIARSDKSQQLVISFDLKKGCSHVIRVVRSAVDTIIKGGNTANLCAIDLSKAFDGVNHHALFFKLMKRLIPNELLALLECWLSTCYSCVKWDDTWSQLFTVNFGVRQGSVLSPILFAVYVDDLAICVHSHVVCILVFMLMISYY